MEEPGGTANEAPPPRRGHPRGVVITSILGRAAKTPRILPIRTHRLTDRESEVHGGSERLGSLEKRIDRNHHPEDYLRAIFVQMKFLRISLDRRTRLPRADKNCST